MACDAFAGARPAVGSADLLVLLGNALLPTAWRSFDAVRAGVAPRLLIAGGIGHSTPLLYQALADEPAAGGLATAGQAEAPLLAALALRQGRLAPSQIWLESASTNCGRTRFARALLQEKGRRRRVCCWCRILMQRRTLATFQRVWQDCPAVQFTSWPTFVPRTERGAGGVTIAGPPAPCGRWIALCRCCWGDPAPARRCARLRAARARLYRPRCHSRRGGGGLYAGGGVAGRALWLSSGLSAPPGDAPAPCGRLNANGVIFSAFSVSLPALTPYNRLYNDITE
ncbi:hypothetical protein O0544_13820 [Edwardsiella anguillarum]|nr:hypothetical protein [Edwardsiella anguillarum]